MLSHENHPLIDVSNMTSMMTQEDIAHITGAKQSSKQIEILSRHRIPHIVDANDKPKLTWYQYNNAHLMGAAFNDEGPDFDSLI